MTGDEYERLKDVLAEYERLRFWVQKLDEQSSSVSACDGIYLSGVGAEMELLDPAVLDEAKTVLLRLLHSRISNRQSDLDDLEFGGGAERGLDANLDSALDQFCSDAAGWINAELGQWSLWKTEVHRGECHGMVGPVVEFVLRRDVTDCVSFMVGGWLGVSPDRLRSGIERSVRQAIERSSRESGCPIIWTLEFRESSWVTREVAGSSASG